jgi:hypothetical protein
VKRNDSGGLCDGSRREVGCGGRICSTGEAEGRNGRHSRPRCESHCGGIGGGSGVLQGMRERRLLAVTDPDVEDETSIQRGD